MRACLFLVLWPLAVHAVERPDLPAVEAAIVAATNAYRARHGADPVTRDAELTTAARVFAQFMATHDRHGHEADGRTPALRATAAGYDHCLIAENIAFHFNSEGFRTAALADTFMQGWIDSPGHRENLVDMAHLDIGVAVVQSFSSKRFYAVQLFGRPTSRALTFSLANDTGGTLRYALDGKSATLPPRVSVTLTRCRGGGMAVTLPGEDQPRHLIPADGDRFVAAKTGKGYAIRTQPRPR